MEPYSSSPHPSPQNWEPAPPVPYPNWPQDLQHTKGFQKVRPHPFPQNWNTYRKISEAPPSPSPPLPSPSPSPSPASPTRHRIKPLSQVAKTLQRGVHAFLCPTAYRDLLIRAFRDNYHFRPTDPLYRATYEHHGIRFALPPELKTAIREGMRLLHGKIMHCLVWRYGCALHPSVYRRLNDAGRSAGWWFIRLAERGRWWPELGTGLWDREGFGDVADATFWEILDSADRDTWELRYLERSLREMRERDEAGRVGGGRSRSPAAGAGAGTGAGPSAYTSRGFLRTAQREFLEDEEDRSEKLENIRSGGRI